MNCDTRKALLAQVLISGEQGGATGRLVFIGFILAFIYKYLHARGRRAAGDDGLSLEGAIQPRGRADDRFGTRAAGSGLHHRDENFVGDDGGSGDRQFGDRAGHCDLWRRCTGHDFAGHPAHRGDGHRDHSIQLLALHRRRLRYGGRHHQYVPHAADDCSVGRVRASWVGWSAQRRSAEADRSRYAAGYCSYRLPRAVGGADWCVDDRGETTDRHLGCGSGSGFRILVCNRLIAV